MGDEFIELVKQIIEDNIGNENFSVSDLAKEVGLSRSTLHRKLIRLTGKSATDFITEIRLTRALELLESDVATISEIAYRVGYSNPSYFNKVFKKTYNVSPSDVRKKGSGKLSHLKVVKEPGTLGSTRSKKARTYIIAGINVLMIIIVAGGAVSLILGPVDNIFPFTRLPEWTIILVIVLFSAVFIVSVVLSWKYHLYLDKGMVKAEQAHRLKAVKKHSLSNRWKIASYIGIVVIVVLIILNIIPRANRKNTIENSIAVLPFINDSEEIGNEHLINGIMEEILINLQSIKELRVPGRTSIEQYRNNPKPIPEIASELNVAYIVEGSGQRYGNKIRLRVELVEGATDKHLWADSYNEEIKGPEDIFRIQSQIAESIAAELEAIITPEEKLLIEKIPTTSLIAHEFYNKGRDKQNQYWLDNDNRTALERAEELFCDALDYASTFALAYTGLAYAYWDKHYWESFFSERFLDSVLILADKALSFDSQLSDAYTVRGNYYRENGQNEQAISEYDKAIKLNPNDGMAHYWRGWTYGHNNFDLVKALEDYHKAASLYRGPFLPSILRDLGGAYWQAGFPEKLQFYAHQALMLDGDSISYYYNRYFTENLLAKGNGKILEKIYLMDTTRNDILQLLGNQYGFEGKFEESLMYFKKYFKKLEDLGSYSVLNMQRLGYAYWMNGFYTEADYYFDKTIEYYDDLINVGRKMFSTNYDLAGIYAFRGEKEKAYENLRIFNQLERIPFWWISLFKIDPLFDNIRDEPEFQQIVRDVEAKYNEEQDRVRKWLEENDML